MRDGPLACYKCLMLASHFDGRLAQVSLTNMMRAKGAPLIKEETAVSSEAENTRTHTHTIDTRCMRLCVHFGMQWLDISKAYFMICGYEWLEKVVVRMSLRRGPKITLPQSIRAISCHKTINSRSEASLDTVALGWLLRLAYGYTFMWPWSLRKCHFQT